MGVITGCDNSYWEQRIYAERNRWNQEKRVKGTSLVIQWLRIHLPMQGTWVQSLVGELKPPHATGQLSLHATVKSPAHKPQRRPCAAKIKKRERESQEQNQGKCLHLGYKQEETKPAKEMGTVWGKTGRAVWHYASGSKEEWRQGSAVDTSETLALETKKSFVIFKRLMSMRCGVWSQKTRW